MGGHVKLDLSTEFGSRVARRLANELIIWLVTVRADDTPQPSPVWFLWDQERFLVYSQPNTPKLLNIARRPTVSLHFDGDGRGGDIVVFTGTAGLAPAQPPADRVPAYLAKYRAGIARIGMTPESFARSYSVALTVAPRSLRGH